MCASIIVNHGCVVEMEIYRVFPPAENNAADDNEGVVVAVTGAAGLLGGVRN